MADDVLRLRATVVSEEALANIRKIGEAVGIIPQRAGRGFQQMNTQAQTLGQTIKNIGKELSQAIPMLGGFGLGAAGVGLAAGAVIRTLTEMSKRIVELKFASEELGMPTQEIRAFQQAADKVNIEGMLGKLQAFRNITEGLKYDFGGVRGELYAAGAAPLVAQLQGAATQGDKLKVALAYIQRLAKEPGGLFRAQRLGEMLGLGPEAVRLLVDNVNTELGRIKPISPQAMADAKRFRDQLIDVSEAWDQVLLKGGAALLPGLSTDLQNLAWMIDKMGELKQLYDDWVKAPSKSTKFLFPENPFFNLGFDPNAPLPRFLGFGDKGTPKPPPPDVVPPPTFAPSQPQPNMKREGHDFPFRPIALRSGEIDADAFRRLGQQPSEGGEASRIIKIGVFDALVDFQSYVQAGGAAGGAGGGFQNAALTTGGMRPSGGLPGMPGFGGGGPQAMPTGPGAGPGGVPGAPGAPSVPGAPGAPAVPGAGPPAVPGAPGAGGPGSVTPGTPGSTGPAGPGGAGGITAPAGTPVAKQGLATVTTPSGKTFRVDARYAENFKGFLADYEKAGGVLGPNTGTLGTRGNPSGHPIGAAIDINQTARDVRKGGVTLPKEVENALADKWGLVSGANWRNPDAGHFGIRSSQAAREALMREGKAPPGVPGGPAAPPQVPGVGQPSYEGGTKATWFHTGAPYQGTPGGPVWSDPSGRAEGAPASRMPSTTPGIATPGRGGLGDWHEVTLPDGRKFVYQKTDVGPGRGPQSKGIGLDINAPFAAQAYPGGPGTFPSGKGGFQVRRIGKQLPSGVQPGLQARGERPGPISPNEMASMKEELRRSEYAEEVFQRLNKPITTEDRARAQMETGRQYKEGEDVPKTRPPFTLLPGDPTEKAQKDNWPQTDYDPEKYRQHGGGKFSVFTTERDREQQPNEQSRGTDRLDRAIDAGNGGAALNATGNVNVNVHTNGTKASTDVKSDGLFQQSTVRQHKQMQPTDRPEIGAEA